MHDIIEQFTSLSISSTSKQNVTSKTRADKLRELLNNSNINHKHDILKEQTFKDAHVYCLVNGLSAQTFGPLLEHYIMTTFNYKKNSASNCTGDFSKNEDNYELKVSLGGASRKRFNFVQLRTKHMLSFYIFTAFHLTHDNAEREGDLYIFKIPKIDMIELILTHGTYAHGTVKQQKKITRESLNDENNRFEYAIRTTYNDSCWKDLLKYRVDEIEL
jgi:hypothetical protein